VQPPLIQVIEPLHVVPSVILVQSVVFIAGWQLAQEFEGSSVPVV